MKAVILKSFFFLSFIFFQLYSRSEETIYIVCDTHKPDQQSLAEDLAKYLGMATGEKCMIQDDAGKSESYIKLELTPGTSNSRKEGFSLKGSGTSLKISATHLNGLKNGVYYYLQVLGFRFYLPGDIWTHTPKISSPFVKIDTTIYPSMPIRTMFPTGGFRKNLAVDPDDRYQKDWDHWLSQNLYSSEEKIEGHMGETFNTKHKKELLADTSLLALVNGRRQWGVSAKWCVSNPNLVSMFVNDRVDAFDKMKQRSPERNWISAEVADGYGDCECDNCKKMGSVSNRYFYLANKAAEAIEKKWPGGGVSLFAYNTHASIPDEAPRSNVFVLVIPYKFQNVMEPSVMLSKWKAKSSNIGVYDYWSPTDASLDLPLFNYLRQMPPKFALWQDLNLKGFLLETGYAKFNNALAFHFFSRMIWFHETDVPAMLKKFCDENFGKAAPVMFTMLERWGVSFKTRFEMPVSLEEIKQAYSLEKDPVVQKRLDEIKAVVVYAVLQDDALSDLKKPGVEEKAETLYKYIWSIHDYRIINTGGVQALVRTRLMSNKKDVNPQWTLADASKNKEFWNQVVQYKPPDPLPETMSNPFQIPLQLNVHYPVSDEKNIDSIFAGNKKFNSGDIINLRGQLQLTGSVLSDHDGTISMNINITEAFKNPERIPVVALYDENGFFKQYKEISKQTGKQKMQFSDLSKNKRYQLVVYANSNFEIEVPNRLFLLDGNAIGTADVQLLSHQQANLMFGSGYTYYVDPYRYMGQLTNEEGKTVISKTKYAARRSKVIEYKPGSPFLKVNSDRKNPFVVEVINGEILYGFSNN